MSEGEIYLYSAMGIGIIAVILVGVFARWQMNKQAK